MRICGYGEDALTLWALSTQLPRILSQLDDKTEPEQCSVLYRPSFGRGRGFGEFDAIIGNARAVYLIEAKWATRSDGTIVVRENQVRRHAIFKSYIKQWQENTYPNWTAFCDASGMTLAFQGGSCSIPRPETQLAKNLYRILRDFAIGAQPRDVLLYLQLPDRPRPLRVQPPEFELVTVDCPEATVDFEALSIGSRTAKFDREFKTDS